MKAIFASKLYKASPRKSAIQSALNDPINSELVQQLRTYLDPDYQKNVLDEGREIKEGDNNGKSNKGDAGNEARPDVSPNLSGTAPASFTSNNASDEEGKSLGEAEQGADGDEQIIEEEPVSESISTNQKSVTASSALSCEIAVDVIKGTLNSRQDTTGVNRILLKESELWIYYEDKVNLNNVMSSVIEFLNSTGYSYLEFNRLARTDNAIVFQIYEVETSNIEPIGDAENGKD